MISLGSLFGQSSPPLVGLDISTSGVRLVELADAGKGVLRLERYASEPLPRGAVVDGNIENIESVSEAVLRVWKKSGTKIRHVALGMPPAAVITKKIILPGGMSEQELEVQVETEANQYIPFSLDEVSLDFCVIGPSPSSQGDVEVLIAASRREKVQDRQGLAEAAGLKPKIYPEIRNDIWLKLWGNLCFNPISALTRATLDVVATDPGTRMVARKMMEEAEVIARRIGAHFRVDIERRINGAASVGAHRTSMLQDLEFGRAMEIEALVGAVEELGRLTGKPTPTISVVLALVRLLADTVSP